MSVPADRGGVVNGDVETREPHGADLAEVLWRLDGYDLNADPDSSTSRELRPGYLLNAREILASDWLAARVQAARVEDAARLAAVEALADKWNDTPDYTPSDYDRGRVDQRHAMTMELLAALRTPDAAPEEES